MAGGNIDLSDNPFENSPKHKVNLSASYDIPLSGDNGTVSIAGQYSYQSRTWYLSAASRYIRIYGATDPNIADSISQKGFGIVNARIHWRDPLGHEDRKSTRLNSSH